MAPMAGQGCPHRDGFETPISQVYSGRAGQGCPHRDGFETPISPQLSGVQWHPWQGRGVHTGTGLKLPSLRCTVAGQGCPHRDGFETPISPQLSGLQWRPWQGHGVHAHQEGGERDGTQLQPQTGMSGFARGHPPETARDHAQGKFCKECWCRQC